MTFEGRCTDCGWTVRDGDRERVTEALERHARKEFHEVTFERIEQSQPAV